MKLGPTSTALVAALFAGFAVGQLLYGPQSTTRPGERTRWRTTGGSPPSALPSTVAALDTLVSPAAGAASTPARPAAPAVALGDRCLATVAAWERQPATVDEADLRRALRDAFTLPRPLHPRPGAAARLVRDAPTNRSTPAAQSGAWRAGHRPRRPTSRLAAL